MIYFLLREKGDIVDESNKTSRSDQYNQRKKSRTALNEELYKNNSFDYLSSDYSNLSIEKEVNLSSVGKSPKTREQYRNQQLFTGGNDVENTSPIRTRDQVKTTSNKKVSYELYDIINEAKELKNSESNIDEVDILKKLKNANVSYDMLEKELNELKILQKAIKTEHSEEPLPFKQHEVLESKIDQEVKEISKEFNQEVSTTKEQPRFKIEKVSTEKDLFEQTIDDQDFFQDVMSTLDGIEKIQTKEEVYTTAELKIQNELKDLEKIGDSLQTTNRMIKSLFVILFILFIGLGIWIGLNYEIFKF